MKISVLCILLLFQISGNKGRKEGWESPWQKFKMKIGKREVTSYSDWMSQLPPELHDIHLYNLAIPGSHNSMSYDLDINSAIIEPERVKFLSKIYLVRIIVRNWAITQVESITKQLDAGVRYIDLRIARKPRDTDPTRLYFYHGLYTRTDVETALKVINDWAERHPKEILILALSHFKGFDKKIEEQLHSHLISFIMTLFGAKLFYKTEHPTLRRCWDKGRNVIVSYEYPALADLHIEIWSKIPYIYGNSMDTRKVGSALRHVLETHRPTYCLYVCGLNLTLPEDARILKYILRLFDNFPNVIHRGLPRLVRWVKEQAGRTPMNIVASDLATRDDFIQTVVKLNSPEWVKA
ncbi:PI-PLC X domain-containing protein 1-like [Sebastes umbrosus]|uniref:PI-PLC X domain-containing protein 1-like n=1 Tax=Sebastes umbrosus TaxID=72105 RepID=UPI00189E84E8|nr:PI-PLC X domain-containing protein 1-like [Sebastes umbrosus]